ncbi:hypothetical protein SPV1_11586 [Mariprofundus ferrooxydans PV-1]|uniref:Uncharacterized protein n=2 Tax=Mariprofundus ferrooxydans TaxID=314344 RepID=Q0F119_9PROT|nr:hypothetical protein SPV1_11586 [Mariprofundus ferrooxydans PV-1]
MITSWVIFAWGLEWLAGLAVVSLITGLITGLITHFIF